MSKPMRMFEKAAFGYRIEDVDNHIEELNNQISSLEAEKEEMLSKMKILAEKINEYRKDEADLKDALLGAQKMGNTIVNEAKEKAEIMLNEAKTRADRMVLDSQKQAEEAISAIHKQVDKEKKSLMKIQKEVSDFKAALLTTYKRHLNIITSLPEMDEETAEFYNEKLGNVKEEVKPEEEIKEQEEKIVEEVEEKTSEENEVAESEEDVSTMRFDKVPEAEAKPTFIPARKSAFEEKFGELKFGKNNNG